MPKFAANLTVLFTEYPVLERIGAAKAAGFDAVEILFPYDEQAKLTNRELVRHDIPLALMNCPPPNYTGGERGFAAAPDLQERFRRDFQRTMRFAEQLRPQFVHIMAGVASGPDAKQAFVDNLIWAAQTAPDQQLTIEPINQTDMPGYFLSDFYLAAEILETVDAPNLSLQYDAYHAQMITGDALAVWNKHKHLVKHIQVGSVPGRHEPNLCDINYPAFFAQLDAEGFTGYVSGEYNPADHTEDDLNWIKP